MTTRARFRLKWIRSARLWLYPTVKARLNRIAGQLEFVDTNPAPLKPQEGRSEILSRLERGEITAAEAIRQLEAK